MPWSRSQTCPPEGRGSGDNNTTACSSMGVTKVTYLMIICKITWREVRIDFTTEGSNPSCGFLYHYHTSKELRMLQTLQTRKLNNSQIGYNISCHRENQYALLSPDTLISSSRKVWEQDNGVLNTLNWLCYEREEQGVVGSNWNVLVEGKGLHVPCTMNTRLTQTTKRCNYSWIPPFSPSHSKHVYFPTSV